MEIIFSLNISPEHCFTFLCHHDKTSHESCMTAVCVCVSRWKFVWCWERDPLPPPNRSHTHTSSHTQQPKIYDPFFNGEGGGLSRNALSLRRCVCVPTCVELHRCVLMCVCVWVCRPIIIESCSIKTTPNDIVLCEIVDSSLSWGHSIDEFFALWCLSRSRKVKLVDFNNFKHLNLIYSIAV